MTVYLLRRLGLAIPTVLGAVVLVFIIVRWLPGDPARALAGQLATAEDVERIRRQLGLDAPLPVQLTMYVVNLLRGDLGRSTQSGQPVLAEVLARLPYTVALAILSVLLATAVGLASGLWAALHRGSWPDVLISAGAVLGVSLPVFWLGLMLIILFAVNLHLVPAGGAQSPQSFVLPTLTMACVSLGVISRMTRSSVLEVLDQDFMRTAKAKGVGALTMLIRHALPNALLPVITVVGIQFGALLGGAVLTETVFSWPGIGRLLVDSILNRDYPVVQGIVLIFSTSFILINLIADLAYAYIDPRIRYE